MPESLAKWLPVLAQWAEGHVHISEVWIFGSRARGDNRPDSDLDIAVVMAGQDQGTRLGNWIALARKWEKELSELVPYKIDLDIGDQDISKQIVGPAIRREGIRIFSRSENALPEGS